MTHQRLSRAWGAISDSLLMTFFLQDPLVVRPSNLVKAASVGNLVSPEPQVDNRSRTGSIKSTRSDKSELNSDKHSMMEFAMIYFRHGK